MSILSNKRITLGVTGSIAAFKAADLASKLTQSGAQVDVILTGPLPTLNSLTPSDVRVLLDLKELGPGTYHITPIIEFVFHDITVESILPGTIEVIISTATTPTP